MLLTPVWLGTPRSRLARRPHVTPSCVSRPFAVGRSGRVAPNRFVYDFDEPSDGGRELLGGKGIGLAEMTQLGVPVPAGFTITTDACRAYMESGGEVPRRARGRGRRAPRRARGEDRQALRRPGRPAPRLRPLGRGGLDARDDGHDPQPRPERRGRAAGLAERTGNARFANDSYRRLIQMYGEVVDGIDGHLFEDALSKLKDERGAAPTSTSPPRTWPALVETFKRHLRERDRQPVPAGRARAARPRRARRLRVLGHPARAGLPPRAPHPRRPRHGRQRRPDGLRQQGRPVGDRRRLHARPVDRRARALRRVPGRRAGRGRRRRDPHARAARARCRRALPEAFEQLIETMRRLEEHYRDMQDIEFTVEDGQALPAPDAQREADGRGGAQGRRRHGRRGPDLARGGRRAHRPRPARPAAAPDDRPDRGASRSSRRA